MDDRGDGRRIRGARRAILWVLIGAAAIFAYNIGGRTYGCHDVDRYALMILELRHGSAGDPTVDSLPYTDAAPMATWLPYLSTEILGSLSPRSVRLHSALAGLAMVALTIVVARVVSDRIAAIAGAAVALNYLAWTYGRSSRIDMALGFAVTGAIAAFFAAGRSCGVRRVLAFLAAGAATALGVAAKGPFAVAVAAAALGPYLVFERRWRDLLVGGLLVGAVAAGLTAAWLVPYTHYLGPEASRALFHEFLLRETVQKFEGHLGKVEPFHFYLVNVPGNLAPWSLIALVAMLRVVRHPRKSSSLERLGFSWAVFPILLLSASGGKHIRYVLPLLPAMGILAGFEIDRWLDADRTVVWRVFRRIAQGLGALTAIGGVTAAVVLPLRFGGAASAWGAAAALAAAGSGIAAFTCARRGRLAGASLGLYLAGAWTIALLYGGVYALPSVSEDASEYYRLAQRVRPWLHPRDELAVVRETSEGRRGLDGARLALYLGDRWVAEFPPDRLPDARTALAHALLPGRTVRAKVDWTREGRRGIEHLLLLAPREGE